MPDGSSSAAPVINPGPRFAKKRPIPLVVDDFVTLNLTVTDVDHPVRVQRDIVFVRNENDGVVIPNYFEPFAKSNVEIDYMISTAAGRPFRIVKGDSDQDRPNIVPVVTS